MEGTPTIIRRNVKHARLRVRQDSRVELVVPNDWQPEEIKSLLAKKAKWIREKRDFFASRAQGRSALGGDEVRLFGELYRIDTEGYISSKVEIDRAGRRLRVGRAFASRTAMQAWQRNFAREVLTRRTRELSERHGLVFGRLFVRSQLTKWGNCSPKRNISLNWRLICVPERVIDYVILHELLHTKVMNHSQAFWVHLRAICPWAHEAIAWLNAHQPVPTEDAIGPANLRLGKRKMPSKAPA